MPQRILLLSALLAALLGGALVRTAAAGATGPEVGVADDRVLVGGGKKAARTVAEWKANGVDSVRIFLVWSGVAPSPKAKKAPKGFDASSPDRYLWGPFDAAVDRVRAAGMTATLTVGGPAPVWATSNPARRSQLYKPRATAFANFSRAVAKHFGSRVNRYYVWNEPNSGAFLLPQTRGRGSRQTIVSALLYRDLVRAAYPAIKRADPGAQVLIGGLAPKAAARKNVTTSPLAFLRAFGCVDARFHRIRSRACTSSRAATGDGFSIHPYGARTAPDLPPRGVDDVNLATLSRLTTTLDRLRRMNRIKGPRRMGIYVDEYGYQTAPPDRTSGIPLRLQDEWLQRGAYLAWRNSRIKLFTQYLWYDEPQRGGSYALWQSGVRFVNGRAKPSLAHFDTPFAVDAERNRLWGQVRPGGRQRVLVQQRLRGRARWTTIRRRYTDARGYWTIKRKLTVGARYRFKAGKATSASIRR